MKNIEIINNKILVTTSEPYFKEKLINEYEDIIKYKDSETIFLNLEFADFFKKDKIKNIIYDNLNNKEKEILNNELKKINAIINNKNIIKNNEDFTNFKNNIYKNLALNDEEEFKEITKIQLENVYKSTRINNSANFSEPGSGKTLMTLMTHLERERQFGKELPLVIICPINAIIVWKKEVLKFMKNISNKDIQIFKKDYEYENYNNKPFYDIAGKRVLITNYHSINKLNNDTFNFIFKNSHIVFDEIHRIKNYEGKMHNSSKDLISNSYSRTIITGTPYSKSTLEIQALLNIAWNYNIPSISDLQFKEYDNRIKNFGENNNDLIKEFSKKIKPYYIKLSKSDDFNIRPPKDNFNNPIIVKSLDIQKKIDIILFEKINQMINILDSNPSDSKNIMEKIGYYYSMAQLNSINPKLLSGQNIIINNNIDLSNIPSFNKLPKIKEAFRFIIDYLNSNDKIIVWFRYKDNINNFHKLLLENGIFAKKIHGETKTKLKEKILDEFADPTNKKIQVLISNPDTIAESISLHKSVFASLFVEQGFSFYQWAQAKDRIHRVGSPKNVIVSHNYIRSNDLKIDKKIYENLLNKLKNNEAIFNNYITTDKSFDKDNDILFDMKWEINTEFENADKYKVHNSFDKYDKFLNN